MIRNKFRLLSCAVVAFSAFTSEGMEKAPMEIAPFETLAKISSQEEFIVTIGRRKEMVLQQIKKDKDSIIATITGNIFGANDAIIRKKSPTVIATIAGYSIKEIEYTFSPAILNISGAKTGTPSVTSHGNCTGELAQTIYKLNELILQAKNSNPWWPYLRKPVDQLASHIESYVASPDNGIDYFEILQNLSETVADAIFILRVTLYTFYKCPQKQPI